MFNFESTKTITLGSCAFRQPKARSHCSKLHGYRLTAKFWFEGTSLDANNWIVDFGALKGLKEALEKNFDHTTCIDAHDPELNTFITLHEKGIIDLRAFSLGVGIERFAEYCWYIADEYVQNITTKRCRVKVVEVFEHELNSAIFVMPVTVQYAVSTAEGLTSVSTPVVKPDVIHGDDLVLTKKQVSEVKQLVQESAPFDYLQKPTKKSKKQFTQTPPPVAIEVKVPDNIVKPVVPQAAPLNCPPLNLVKTTNTFSDPFAGTSWGNSSRRVK